MPRQTITTRVVDTVRPASYKPVSVPLRATAIRLDRTLLPGSSDLPESQRSEPLLLSYLVLLRVGFALPGRIAPSAVRSYRTISPLPRERRYIFCGTFREIRFERIPPAVSRHAVLWRPDFPPLIQERPPARQAESMISRIRPTFALT